MQKHKPPISAWIASERKRHGWKVDELSRRLTDAGYEAQPPTIQVWEAGRKPRDETVSALERLFGSAAPRDQPASDANTAVLRAIEKQTEMLERQWAATTALVGNLTALVEEMRMSRAEQSGRDTALVDILARLEVAQESASTPAEADSRPEPLPQSK